MEVPPRAGRARWKKAWCGRLTDAGVEAAAGLRLAGDDHRPTDAARMAAPFAAG